MYSHPHGTVSAHLVRLARESAVLAMSVFATVGTTQFDKLIETLLTDDVLGALARHGYHTLRLQVGRGAEPAVPAQAPIHIEW